MQWKWGTVVSNLGQVGRLQEVEVQIEAEGVLSKVRALHDSEFMGVLADGDRVMLNRTASQLDLGSGGYDFVVCSDREPAMGKCADRENGHIMKLRYTPLQRRVLAVEEQASPHHGIFEQRLSLERTPVLIGELHSMLPIAGCMIRQLANDNSTCNPDERPTVAYVMTDGGALPLGYSNHAAALRAGGWLNGTVTYGHAYGGDIEAVNKFTALLAAKHVLKADIIIVCMGPGISGTATPLGHSGMETGELINAVSSLGGLPILMPRISFAESRERHFGVSHHLLSAVTIAAHQKAILPLCSAMPEQERQRIALQLQAIPELHNKLQVVWVGQLQISDVERSLRPYPLAVKTMGRQLHEDAVFFLSVSAAAKEAWQRWREDGRFRT